MGATKWRLVKEATHRKFDYVGVEFDKYGNAYAIRLHAKDTSIRKRTTTQFEAFENHGGKEGICWGHIGTKEVPQYLKETNMIRAQYDLKPLLYDDLLNLLYQANRMKDLVRKKIV